MMTYAFRDTHFARLHKIGCFWSPYGEKWRGALQVYVRWPRYNWCWLRLDSPVQEILAGIPATGWTGRQREIHWRIEPGFLQIELRTPCRRSWSFKCGRL